jgi:hypothetical protein
VPETSRATDKSECVDSGSNQQQYAAIASVQRLPQPLKAFGQSTCNLSVVSSPELLPAVQPLAGCHNALIAVCTPHVLRSAVFTSCSCSTTKGVLRLQTYCLTPGKQASEQRMANASNPAVERKARLLPGNQQITRSALCRLQTQEKQSYKILSLEYTQPLRNHRDGSHQPQLLLQLC